MTTEIYFVLIINFCIFMKKGKKFEHYAEQKREERIYNRIIKGLVVAGIALFFIHWGYSLCVVCFILWSAYFYEQGRMEWVCDEYEQNGYPTQGLYRMYRCWVSFAVLLAAVLIIIYLNFSS